MIDQFLRVGRDEAHPSKARVFCNRPRRYSSPGTLVKRSLGGTTFVSSHLSLSTRHFVRP